MESGHPCNLDRANVEASIGSGYFVQITRSHLVALVHRVISRICSSLTPRIQTLLKPTVCLPNAIEDSSEQWCSRITGKETINLLGPLFRRLLRISPAQLTGLNRV